MIGQKSSNKMIRFLTQTHKRTVIQTLKSLPCMRSFSSNYVFLNSKKAKEFYEIGLKCMEKGEFEEAVDNFKKSLSIEDEDKEILDYYTIRELAFSLHHLDRLDEAQYYLNILKTLIPIHEKYQIEAMEATILVKKRQFDDAIKMMQRISKSASFTNTDTNTDRNTDERIEWAMIYYEFGSTLLRYGERKSAISFIEMAKDIISDNDDAFRLVKKVIFRDLACLYHEIGNLDEAIKLFKECITILEQDGETNTIQYASMLEFLADCQINYKGYVNDAFNNAEKARKICYSLLSNKEISKKQILQTLLSTLKTQIKCFTLWKQYERAYALCEVGLKLAEQGKIETRRIEILHSMARIQLHFNNFEECQDILRQAMEHIEKLDPANKNKLLVSQYDIEANVHFEDMNFEKYFECAKQSIAITRELYPEDQSEILMGYHELISGCAFFGKINEMESLVEELIEYRLPLTTDIKFYLANAYFVNDKFENAIKYLKEIISELRCAPNLDKFKMVCALEKLMSVYQKIKNYEEALSCNEQLIEIIGENEIISEELLEKKQELENLLKMSKQ